MSAPIVETKTRILASGQVVNIPVVRKTVSQEARAKAIAKAIEVSEKSSVAPSLVVAKKTLPECEEPITAEGGGGSAPTKHYIIEPGKLIIPNITDILAKKESPKSEPWYYIKRYKTYPSNWIRQGMLYLTEAMRIACLKVKNDPKSLSRFGTISVPITLITKDRAKKDELVYEGAWNQGQYIQGPYDSPDINFDNEDKTIGGRIGIRWIAEDSPADEPGKSWWGVIRLTCEYSPFTKGKDNKWEAHVRCEYEKADDYEDTQNIVDKALDRVVKENKDNIATFDVGAGESAYEISQKTIDAYIAKTEKPTYELGTGPCDAQGKELAKPFMMNK